MRRGLDPAAPAPGSAVAAALLVEGALEELPTQPQTVTNCYWLLLAVTD